MTYEAILLISFGGPEGPDDVMPFLENVTRGRGIPRERLEAVAHHYYALGGVSPINAQNRELISALRNALTSLDVDLPIYWGNRNWQPMLADALQQIAAALGLGFKRVPTVGIDPRFVGDLAAKISASLRSGSGKVCPGDCCPNPRPRP